MNGTFYLVESPYQNLSTLFIARSPSVTTVLNSGSGGGGERIDEEVRMRCRRTTRGTGGGRRKDTYFEALTQSPPLQRVKLQKHQ